MSTYVTIYNERNQAVVIDGLGDSIEVQTLTIDEAASPDLFRVRSKTAAISILNRDNSLYYANLRGTAVSISVAGVTVFTGVIASVPEAQPYSHAAETFAIYCDDVFARMKYQSYATTLQTVGSFLSNVLGVGYRYTPANDIDITNAMLSLDALTDTTTTVFDALTEVAKLLNVEVVDGSLQSPVVAPTPTPAIVAHFATTSLGVREGIQSAEIQIVEDAETTTAGEGDAEEVGEECTWGELYRVRIEMTRSDSATAQTMLSQWCWGLVQGLTWNISNGICTTPDEVPVAQYGAYVAQYYRYGLKEGVVYGTGCQEIQLATQVIQKPQNTTRAQDAEAVAAKWAAGKYPAGVPSFSVRTIIDTSNNLYIGAVQDQTDPNYQYYQDLVEQDLARDHVYFTRRYNVTVPPLTAYKTQHYIVYRLNVEMFAMRTSLGQYAFDGRSWSLGYKPRTGQDVPVGPEDGHAVVNLRIYSGTTILYSTQHHINLVDIAETYSNILSVSEVQNGTWTDGVATSGFRLSIPTEYDISSADAIEIDFLGIGAFRGTIFNNIFDGTGRDVYKYSGYPDDTNRHTLPIRYYTVDLSPSFAAGYLVDETPPDYIVEEEGTTEDKTSLFYWERNAGTGSVVLSNKLNSLVEQSTKSTVRVGDGYLGKVTSSVYTGTHYTEVFQLATIIDQQGQDVSRLEIDLFTLVRFGTYNGRTYRLIGYSYDVIRGVYRCTFLQLMTPTTIEIE